MTIQYPNKLDKNRPIYFAMDHTCGTRTGSSYETTCNCKIRDTIVNKLKAKGFNVVRTAIGPNELYQNMKYIADNNITNAILFNLFNGVDPANIREVSFDNADGNGKKFRNNGNDAVLAWFYDSCDFTRSDGTCYASVRDSETHTGRLYNPLEYCKNNKIYVINQSSNNHKNSERADYTGDKIADAFIALFEENTPTVEQENTNIQVDENKTIRTVVTTKTYTIPFYEKVFQVKTDINGSFSIKPDLPYRGEYKATMRYGGDRTHNGCNESISIYNYDKNAKVFKEQLLQTTVLVTYTDGTTSRTDTGSVGNATNIKRVIKTETYEGGAIVSTTEKTIDVSSILVEADTSDVNNITDIPSSSGIVVTGDKKSPFENSISMINNVPNVAAMNHAGKDFALVTNRTYTLNEEQYRGVFKRDSKILQVKNYKSSKFVAFESTDSETWNVCPREVWNAVEESIYYYMVGHNGCKWPSKIVVDFTNHNTKLYEDSTLVGTVNWKSSSCQYHVVSDHQNWNTSCGDTSASVCSQWLHNYYSEWRLQNEFGLFVAPSKIKQMFDKYNMSGEVISGARSIALEWLKQGKPFVWHCDSHYIAMLDITDDDSKILVSNSAYGLSGVHSTNSGNWGLNTGWNAATSTSYHGGAYGAHVKASCNWSISNEEQQQLINFFDSMGGAWIRNNTSKQNESLRRQ